MHINIVCLTEIKKSRLQLLPCYHVIILDDDAILLHKCIGLKGAGTQQMGQSSGRATPAEAPHCAHVTVKERRLSPPSGGANE